VPVTDFLLKEVCELSSSDDIDAPPDRNDIYLVLVIRLNFHKLSFSKAVYLTAKC